MPSPDDTFYNIKRLHVVFAFSSAALLAVSVWMLAADHWRPWKVYQRTFRDQIEPWLTEAQIRQEESDGYAAKAHELEASLRQSRAKPIDRTRIEQFCDEVARDAEARGERPPDFSQVMADFHKLAGEPCEENRRALFKRLHEFVAAAQLRLDNADRRLRFRRADFDEARSIYEAAVGQGMPQTQLEAIQRRVDGIKADVARLAAQQDVAAAHQHALARILGELTRDEHRAYQALVDHRARLDRMQRTLEQQNASWGKDLLRLPLVDALGSSLSVEQIWLPELQIDYNFRRVARFDRCTTCHLGIDKSRPGRPSDPACLDEQTLDLKLARPVPDDEEGDQAEEGQARGGEKRQPPQSRLEELYGLALAPYGMLDSAAPTVGLVLPKTAAANALLLPGDVILEIDRQPVANAEQARSRLIQAAVAPGSPDAEKAGQNDKKDPPPIELKIRRGVPLPYCSHARLDLFVGSLSPHPLAEFGCTICHEGQGSATDFKFASHTPDRPDDRRRWESEYGWFWNPYWDLPMRASRFTESSCLRCHHDVTDLEPSERFRDPPAPKLLEGYHLVRRNGCFGCHEIKGMLESGERVGPDMRLEPNYHEAALELLAGGRLSQAEQHLARQVVERPEEPAPRRQLAASILEPGGKAATENLLSSDSRAMAKLLAAEYLHPGTMRKVGPSLRDTASKLDAAFLESWLGNPSGFRPGTRMPHFFGLHEHLEGKSLEDAKRFEAVEIRAIGEYLLWDSQPVPPLEPPAGVTEPPSAERGKELFLTKGCAACHQHEDCPHAKSVQGPDLTRLGSKITTGAGRKWLVSWIRDPARHSPRTLMSNALLAPIPLQEVEADENGTSATQKKAEGEAPKVRLTDPAADLAAYLLESKGRQPGERVALVESDLDELALMHLSKTYTAKLARQYLATGIPEALANEIEGDARELIGKITQEKKLRYVGRRTIRKRGCFGCHDIPGFEDAQAIGPALSDWGRKQPSLLAFNQVHQFLADGTRRACEKTGTGTSQPAKFAAFSGVRLGAGPIFSQARSAPAAVVDQEFYVEAIRGRRREGFLWQKLRAPRSFDYKTTANKPYNEQLTMGRFNLTGEQREAIMTFVLGLVADPPSKKYVYQPDARGRAMVEGRKVLDKYGCAECHTLELERWKFEYDPNQFEDPAVTPDFDFAKPRIEKATVAASMATDRRGLGQAEVVGMPRVDEAGELVADEDDDGNPLYFFTLWEPAAINGRVWPVGGADVMISKPRLLGRRAPRGGAYARLLYPLAIDRARASGAAAAEAEAWSWVPPALVHEGAVVEPSWLYDYLLNPVPIRPAVVLRMPKFNLSADEARKLVDYFAAVSRVEFPYTSLPAGRAMQPSGGESQRMERLQKAMRLVTDRTTYCAKCHLIGDFSPGGEVKTILAPNLEQVGRRLRPEYLRRWLANPKSVLPYTGMPVNFPPEGPPMGQQLYQGSSSEQLDAVSDLLLNYDWYLRRCTSIRELIQGETP